MIGLILKLGGLQALLLGTFLLRKKTNNSANTILAVLVFALGVSCFFYSFNNLAFYTQFPHSIRVDWGIPLLFGPLIYLYTLFLTDSDKWNAKLYWHFLPYFINLVILIPFFVKFAEEKIQILDYFTASITSGTDYYFYYHHILRLAISIICISYTLESIKVLKAYQIKLLQEYSNLRKLRLEWLRLLLYSFFLTSIFFIIVSIFLIKDRYPQFDYNIYYFLLIFVLIYVLSYKTLSQPEILIPSAIKDPSPGSPKKINISEKSSEQSQILRSYMLAGKPYLDGDLTASRLAIELNMSRHQLSNVLNDQIGQNFYDFINEYRIEEFKERLASPKNKNLTLLGIAFDAGFNSKTTFNTIFKKATGLTPSQYRKEQNKFE